MTSTLHFPATSPTWKRQTHNDKHGNLREHDTGHALFIVHTPNGDGTWTAHAIPQEYLMVTYFRGNECCHMACDLYTWFHEIGMHSLSVLMRDYVKNARRWEISKHMRSIRYYAFGSLCIVRHLCTTLHGSSITTHWHMSHSKCTVL